MAGYYSEKLSADRLRKCYEIASPRVRQYLQAEIDFVLDQIKPYNLILELGCGYGRAMLPILQSSKSTVGIDSSHSSLVMGREFTKGFPACHFSEMDAASLGFQDSVFDAVLCIQNGISAFKVDRIRLIEESLRVTRPGGMVLFSSYARKFWSDRLEWFEAQSYNGLLGEIDHEATGNGIIVCKDGFRANTISPEQFIELTSKLNIEPKITEVDESSLFCVISKH
jgi:2-polyprenyl-6-hydroxyphenyl methylase/3-demethylubiquinone-9 3-methyltransferase